MFPNGWPGRGLLILRLAAGGFFLSQGITTFVPGVGLEPIMPASLIIVAAVLLLIGLWTPVGCLLAVVAESWLLFVGYVAPAPGVLLLSNSLALSMLGPGSWSIDATIFGRRRVDIINQ